MTNGRDSGDYCCAETRLTVLHASLQVQLQQLRQNLFVAHGGVPA